MKKRNAILSVVVIALVLILALGVMVACDPNPPAPETKTVTFKDGDAVVGSPVTVDKGTALTAEQIPTAPSKANHTFDGWFVGTTKVEAGYVVNDDVIATAKYTAVTKTVTFKDGETTVGTPVTVNQGTALTAAQIPAGPVKANKNFNGWFVGNTKVEAGYVVNDDVNAVASYTDYPVVTFTVNSSVVKTVELAPGTQLTITDLPDDPVILGYAFDGWFNGTAKLDVADLPTITESVNYVAKLTRSAWVVTFVEAGQDDVVKTLPIPSTTPASNPTVPSGFVPSAHTVADKTFTGWYNGVNKIEVGTVITEDTTFTANFVGIDDFVGLWSSDEAGKELNLKVSKVLNDTSSEDAYYEYFATAGMYFTDGHSNPVDVKLTYDPSTGTMSYTNGLNRSQYKALSINLIGDYVVFEYKYLENVVDDYIARSIVSICEKATSTQLVGYYYRDKYGYINIADGGVVTDYSGNLHYGKLFKVDDAHYTLKFKTNSTGELVEANIEVDENGNLVAGGSSNLQYANRGLFVKNGSSANTRKFSCSGSGVDLFEYSIDQEKIWVWSNLSEQTYGYIEGINGEVNDGDIIVFTFDGNDYKLKVSGENYSFPGDEAGTYTGVVESQSVTMVLDGFGNITGSIVDDATDQVYIVAPDNIIICADVGITIDKSTMTFVFITPIDNGISGSYSKANSTNYTADFYNFGKVCLTYKTSSSTYYYWGDYTVSNGKIVVADINYNIDGTYEVEESGDILVGTTFIYVKDGAVLTSHEEEFAGWWKDTNDNYVNINTTTKKINYNDTAYTYAANYNGTVLTFTAKDSNDAGVGNNDHVYTVTLADATLTISHNRVTGFDGDGFAEETLITETYTKTTEPVVELDAFEGKWSKSSGSFAINYVLFDGKGTVKVGSSSGVETKGYTINNSGKAEFNYGGCDYTATISGSSLTLAYEDEEYGTFSSTYSKVEKDAFAGDWTRSDDNFYAITYSFDGYGTLTVSSTKYPDSSYYNGTHAYTIYQGEAMINDEYFLGYNWSFKIVGGVMTVANEDYDGYNGLLTGEVTKVGGSDPAPVADAFAGTWSGKIGMANYTVVCDGLGNININDTDYTYTPGSSTISVGVFTVTMNGEKMHVVYDDGDYSASGDLTKQ